MHLLTLVFGTPSLSLHPHATDWVRLRSGFEPPHLKPGGSSWDEGYQITAYFLQWLTERYGEGTVPEMNELMKNARYEEHIFKTVTGRKVSKLWKLYKEDLEGGGGASSITYDPRTSESEVEPRPRLARPIEA